MDKVIITDLLARGIIGINDWERERPQDILINITIITNMEMAGESDDIKDSINYKTVSKNILAHAENSKRLTVEALASDIAKICLAQPGALQVRVRVEKPGAVRFAKSVGVEIERSKI